MASEAAFCHLGHFVVLGQNVIWALCLWAFCRTWAFCHLGHYVIQSLLMLCYLPWHANVKMMLFQQRRFFVHIPSDESMSANVPPHRAKTVLVSC